MGCIISNMSSANQNEKKYSLDELKNCNWSNTKNLHSQIKYLLLKLLKYMMEILLLLLYMYLGIIINLVLGWMGMIHQKSNLKREHLKKRRKKKMGD